MTQAIILLLILIHLKIFKGWFLALWIIDVVLQVLAAILKIMVKVLGIDD